MKSTTLHNQENYIREALTNTGTPIFKSRKNVHCMVGWILTMRPKSPDFHAGEVLFFLHQSVQ